MTDLITSAQLRAARALLDWSIIDLSKVAQVSASTIKRMEHDHLRPAADRSVVPIRRALEAAGVQFLPDDGDGPGLRYKASPRGIDDAGAPGPAVHAHPTVPRMRRSALSNRDGLALTP